MDVEISFLVDVAQLELEGLWLCLSLFSLRENWQALIALNLFL